MHRLTLHLPHCLKTLLLLLLPSTSIVAISCLFCMDFDCTRGVGGGSHPALTSHTKTQITYMGAPKGRKKKLALRGFVYQICCQIMSAISCQVTVFRLRHHKRMDSSKSTPQCNFYNFSPLYITHIL